MKRKIVIGLLVVMIMASGCSASLSRMSAGDSHVTWAAGNQLKEWDSDGKVLSEDNSDGWYFTDAKTGRLVIVSGNVVIEAK